MRKFLLEPEGSRKVWHLLCLQGSEPLSNREDVKMCQEKRGLDSRVLSKNSVFGVYSMKKIGAQRKCP
jgi:hypothetical protein